jgi:ABC-type lipoprotein release transport system permease subunit
MGRILLIAVRNLLQHTRRTLLLGGAILGVTLLLVLLGSLGNGIKTTMLDAGLAMTCGHVNVGGFYKISSGTQPAPVIVRASALIADVREAVPDAVSVIDRGIAFAKIVSESDNLLAGVTGIDPAAEDDLERHLRVVKGDIHRLSEVPNSILIFERQAKRLNVEVGDQVTLSAPIMKGQNNSLSVQVVAIAKDMGLMSIMASFVPKQTVTELYQLDPDTTGVIQVYIQDPSKARDVEARLRTALLAKGHALLDLDDRQFWTKFEPLAGEDWTGLRLDLTTWEGQMADMKWSITTFETITSILITILLLIIVLGVMNTMWITIRERTREVGTLRAIGMGRFRILAMFLMEMALLSGSASLLGVGAGVGLAQLLNALGIPVSEGFQIFLMSDTLRLVISEPSLIMALVFVPVLTTLSALLPAITAARMRPVNAMHHVG